MLGASRHRGSRLFFSCSPALPLDRLAPACLLDSRQRQHRLPDLKVANRTAESEAACRQRDGDLGCICSSSQLRQLQQALCLMHAGNADQEQRP